MPKTMSREHFATLMADTAMKMPPSPKVRKKDYKIEDDTDLKSNEWADAVQCLNQVGPSGRVRKRATEGGFKHVPMTRAIDMPEFIQDTVSEALLELGIKLNEELIPLDR